MNIFLSALSGLLLALAFPKFNLWWLAWIALVPFFLSLRKAKNWQEALICGALFSLTFFCIHLFWVNTLIRFVGGWAFLAWISFALFQTLFILLFTFLTRPVKNGFWVIWFPLLFTGLEWLRSLGAFGTTVGDIGYSQAAFLPLIQIASITTVYSISFLVVLANAALVQFILDQKKWRFLVFSLLLTGLVIIYGGRNLLLPVAVSNFKLPKLALIQPNIEQKMKMDPGKVQAVFEIQAEMTRQAAKEKPAIIIWPETAVFTYLLQDPVLFPQLKQLAQDTGAWLVFGTPYYNKVNGKIHNSLVSISPSGEIVSVYSKQQLVPFGEYLPFKNILYPFLKGTGMYDQNFDPDPLPQKLLANGQKIAAAICFESTFPTLIRQRAGNPTIVGKEADFILTVTNDGWFGNSSVPYFHLNTGIFRAIENRKYFVQVGNTGISAVVDPFGRILQKSAVGKKGILFYPLGR